MRNEQCRFCALWPPECKCHPEEDAMTEPTCKPVIGDRIDQMGIDELRAATRALLRTTFGLGHIPGVSKAQSLFEPTTLDKVRELLKAEGWRVQDHTGGEDWVELGITHTNGKAIREMWVHP